MHCAAVTCCTKQSAKIKYGVCCHDFVIFSDICSNQLSCQNGGYQDPKNCSQCLCPDQWVGTLCEVINPGSEGTNFCGRLQCFN